MLCLLLIFLGAVLLLESDKDAREAPRALILFCGIVDLRPPVDEIVEIFQRRSGIRVKIRCAASGHPMPERVDVLLFAEDDLRGLSFTGLKLAADTRTVAAWLVPVIQVAAGNPRGIGNVSDLVGLDGMRLALADERETMIGRITPEIFAANGISMEAMHSNKVFTVAKASALGRAVSLGRADAAIIWRPSAYLYPATEIIEIPSEYNRKVAIEAAVTDAADLPQVAGEFVDFLSGPFARKVFARHQYDPASLHE